MALQLIRTITPSVGTLPIDTDWAGTLSAPGFAAWAKPSNVAKALFIFRGYDAATLGNQIGLVALNFDFAVVAGMRLDGITDDHLAQLVVASAFKGSSLALEVDLPAYATNVYPRIASAGASVPASLRRLEIWAEGQGL